MIKNTHKKKHVFGVLTFETAFDRLIELRQALSREQSLSDIIPICFVQAPCLFFGRNNRFNLHFPYSQKPIFHTFLCVDENLKQRQKVVNF